MTLKVFSDRFDSLEMFIKFQFIVAIQIIISIGIHSRSYVTSEHTPIIEHRIVLDVLLANIIVRSNDEQSHDDYA